jgi:flagellar biosynthesis regulator FlbT
MMLLGLGTMVVNSGMVGGLVVRMVDGQRVLNIMDEAVFIMGDLMELHFSQSDQAAKLLSSLFFVSLCL